MALSNLRVISDGTLVTLDVSFDFFDHEEIRVYFNSAEQTPESGVWFWGSERNISFYSPVPQGTEVMLQRTTDASELRHEFSKGSEFKADTLDENFRQVLHIVQEATESNFSKDFFGNINMNGNQIENLGRATDPNHALTLGQAQEEGQNAWAGAAASAASAAQSAASATTAGQHATTAGQQATASAQSATASAGSASAASGSATTATNQANLALGYRNEAGNYANLAGDRANTALTHANTAQAWAIQLGSPVSGGEYSAKYWAQQAANNVIPDASIVERKLPQRDDSNMFPDHNYMDVPGAWTAADSTTLAGMSTYVNATLGRTLRTTMNVTGTANALAWFVRSRQFRVIPGSVLRFTSTMVSSGTAGSYRIELLWRNAAGDSIGTGNVVTIGNPVAPVTGGTVELDSYVTVPAGTVYCALQLRAQHNGSGAWNGYVDWCHPSVKQYVAAPAGTIAWEQLRADVQTGRWLPMGGGTLTGPLTAPTLASTGEITATGSITVGSNPTGGYSNWLQFATSTGNGVLQMNPTGLSFIFDGAIRATLHRDGSFTALSHVYGNNGQRLAYVSEAVRMVNGVGPDLTGNVAVSGGVPLDAWGGIGSIEPLIISVASTAVNEGAVYNNNSTALYRMRCTDAGQVTLGNRSAGTWRVLGIIGFVGSNPYGICQRIA